MDNGYKLEQGRFQKDPRMKKKNSLKLIKNLIRLSREAMKSLSWQVFKMQLNQALRNVVSIQCQVFPEQETGLEISQSHF